MLRMEMDLQQISFGLLLWSLIFSFFLCGMKIIFFSQWESTLNTEAIVFLSIRCRLEADKGSLEKVPTYSRRKRRVWKEGSQSQSLRLKLFLQLNMPTCPRITLWSVIFRTLTLYHKRKSAVCWWHELWVL